MAGQTRRIDVESMEVVEDVSCDQEWRPFMARFGTHQLCFGSALMSSSDW